MRLDKYLCDCGVGTRSQVKKELKQKKVKVNGDIITDAKYQVDEKKDKVIFAGSPVLYQEYIYYLFHKPAGCVCAREDDLHDTVFSYVPMNAKGDLSPVGRLDLDTEGLLIITNDGAFSHALLSPRKHVDKTYFAKLDNPAKPEDIDIFMTGMDIGDDKPTKPAVLRIDELDAKKVYITISEGRFHQVKRMVAAVGKEVLYLKRLSMGRYLLPDDLKPGEYRTFTEEELSYVNEYKSSSI